MAWLPTGRTAYQQADPNNPDTQGLIGTELYNEATGQVLWQGPSGVSSAAPSDYIVGTYGSGVQEAINKGSVPIGGFSPDRAQGDPRGLAADLVRGQWADFVKTALPVRDSLQQMTTYNGNKGVADGLKASGMASAATSFDNAVGTAQRQTQRLGMAMDPREQTVLTRATSLGKTAAMVDAGNRAQDFQDDLNRQIVAGSGMAGGRSYAGG